MTTIEALLTKAANIAETTDNIDYFGASDTRLDEIILDAKRLIALAELIKLDLQTTRQ